MSANGRLLVGELTTRSGAQLAHATAAAWDLLAAACLHNTGVTLDIVNRWGGYRDWDDQQYLFTHPPLARRIAPAGQSTHGLGTAVDVTYPTLDAAGGWVQRNCRTYGFAPPPSNDRNHLRYIGTVAATSGTATPIPDTIEEEDDMVLEPIYAVVNGTPSWCIINWATCTAKVFYTQSEANTLAVTVGSFAPLAQQDYANRIALMGLFRATITEPPLVVDATALAAALAPLLDGDTGENALVQQLTLALAPQFAAIHTNIDAVPADVIAEQKKPGN